MHEPVTASPQNGSSSDDFGHLCVLHPNLTSALDQIYGLLENRSGVSIVSVVGPTGIGKTTLCRLLYKKVVEKNAGEMAANPGLIPVGYMKLPAYENSRFKWNDFWQRGMGALKEVHIDKKKLPMPPVAKHMNTPPDLTERSASEAGALRRGFENALYHRGVECFIIDEAQGFNVAGSARGQNDSMNILKSLAESVFGESHNTLFVLVGTYELLQLQRLNGQLAKRTWTVEFPRYHLNAEPSSDAGRFANIVKALQRKLPLETAPPLVELTEYLWQMSLGCVGILKPWLDRALQFAIRRGSSVITPEDLKKKEKAGADLLTIYNEILEGEARMTETAGKTKELLSLLKGEMNRGVATNDRNNSDGNRSVSRRRVGRPKAKRYDAHLFARNGQH